MKKKEEVIWLIRLIKTHNENITWLQDMIVNKMEDNHLDIINDFKTEIENDLATSQTPLLKRISSTGSAAKKRTQK